MSIVNSEGEVPSDLAEEPAMKDLLLEQVKKQGNPGVKLPGGLRHSTTASHRCPACTVSVTSPRHPATLVRQQGHRASEVCQDGHRALWP